MLADCELYGSGALQIISIVQLLFYAVRTFWQVKNTAYLAVSGYN